MSTVPRKSDKAPRLRCTLESKRIFVRAKRTRNDRYLRKTKLPTYTLVTFPDPLGRVPIKTPFSYGSCVVNNLGSYFIVQSVFAFGLAGLFWPDKFMPIFEILMFPWSASYRAIRAHSIAAIGLSLVLVVALIAGNR